MWYRYRAAQVIDTQGEAASYSSTGDKQHTVRGMVMVMIWEGG